MKIINSINENKTGQIFWSILICLILFGCKKNWLDEKPTLSLAVPKSISDFQALLDNTANGGVEFNNKQSGYEEISERTSIPSQLI
jgi:hypothetical protein